ncbi:UDP-N-acetylmuramoyl-tripeptide--D-alanyl-D-alanine ligase [Methylomarinum sp. Ch1-1]|uniref:UDP-N-acetylmuramoyl-tripeptide--D-alanyl-D-alanine ligase n=1 Tax=Methylomarinum roseum TaxID=3067653 RepID=A0AAU7NXN3_9GAMM|nr:UDP-N-acetylmuramoyl-tripeptide--D-alanyl-D-alanine ligase [Methylomarinum sp. Ch1-1]MDP4522171.1 UDP-N-acetylmuramoyl-tripeptide--D-alanyl-D-alanine ligase [Methylomarinum sp. Ch1-1]
MKFKLSDIATAVQGRLIGAERTIEAVSIDSRTLQSGDLYIAIKGENFDGHDFIDMAVSAGASAVIGERRVDIELPQVVVSDSRLALAELAGAWRRKLPLKVAGVTGSNGKTTVKEMITAILSVSDPVLSTLGNLNNDIGVPLTLLRLDHHHRYAVIEMGANHPGEIAYSSRYAQPDVAVITNVGAAHIEGFGDLQTVAASKGEMIATLVDDGIAVLNAEDEFYSFWQRLAGQRRTVSFGFRQTADVRAVNIGMRISNDQFVTQFDIDSGAGRETVQMQLAGVHNVSNALAAATVCLQFGIGLAQIRQGLATMRPVTGRLQPWVGKRGSIVIDDSYNANPSSLQAALEVLGLCQGEPWLVLGAFAELGEDSARLHREMGQLCKTMKVARLFAIGADAQHCVEGFGEGGMFFDSLDELIASLQQQLTGNETILIKGSRARKMEQVAAALVENFRA